ncbi:MAG: translocation/assembly module TamB domain-containing protein [Acidibrevibacterium sp.]|uniref:translocation/assembly module TamB n=1 Tax=Acidibrevibacterium fodinaquatile TaxID=1969806 RepID=UPI0023A850E1|nr:translocation/assembly module TamB [Acidibrevibacterium fodinaquatile]MCA7119978.1 translocation/assembly module TamB domain-containing protein [Acidibrevibacterium fodinaquatile]
MARAVRRLATGLGVAFAAIVLGLVLGLVLVGVALNTGLGQHAVERYAPTLTGGMVHLAGLTGRFPDRLRLGALELDDGHGPWLRIENAALDLDLAALIARELRITRLAAGRISVARLPEATPAPAPPPAPAQRHSLLPLPVRLVLARLEITRLEIAAPVAGQAMALAIQGAARLRALDDAEAALDVTALDDHPGHYTARLTLAGPDVTARVNLDEPASGLIATLGKMPSLGAISAAAHLAGRRTAAALGVTLAAGPLRADLSGRVDLDHLVGDLKLTANAPAMAPAPGVSFRAATLAATATGPFAAPQASGHLEIDAFAAAGARVGTITADLAGDTSTARLNARLEAIHLPGPAPDLLATAPLTLAATLAMTAPTRPASLALDHPLLHLAAQATLGGPIATTASLDLPDLAPLAAIGKLDLAGRAHLLLSATLPDADLASADLAGDIAIAGGLAPIPALLGTTHLAAAARYDRAHGDVPEAAFTVDGRALSLAAAGGLIGGSLGWDWHLALADLAAVNAALAGAIDGHGHVAGRLDDLAATAHVAGRVSAAPLPETPFRVEVAAQSLPAAPRAHLTLAATLDRAPLHLALDAARDADGAARLALTDLGWKSLAGTGQAELSPAARLPTGKFTLRFARLADLAPVIKQNLIGSVTATATAEQDRATLDLTADDAGIAGTASVAHARLAASVTAPTSAPALSARLSLQGIAAGSLAGDATLSAAGKRDALVAKLDASLKNLAGAPASASASATLDAEAKRVALTALAASWHGETLQLLSPMHLTFADGIALDRLALGLGAARMTLAGQLTPRLDATARLDNLTPALAAPFLPQLANSAGVVTMAAHLNGAPARPSGTVTLTATGLHAASGPASAMPPADLRAKAALDGHKIQLDSALDAGRDAHLVVAGAVPMDPDGAFALTARGRLNLALLDPILTAGGQRVTGALALNAGVSGTRVAPSLSGGATLSDGEARDFAQGLDLRAIAARLEASGETLRIVNLTAKAGQGTITASGTIGALAPNIPLDLTLSAQNASPITTDQLTERLDSDLHISGAALTAIALGGTVTIKRAEITIPDSLPPTVTTLQVRRAGAPPAPAQPSASGPDITLALAIIAPEAVFIHGRGIDAELGGRLDVSGEASAPVVKGGLTLRRGLVSLGGTSLNFTSGTIGFEGGHSIDPALNLVATSSNGNVSATLTVGGFASAPKITLASAPELPQDDILAHLLFGQSASQLSALQLAEIAAGVAQLSGAAGPSGAMDSLRSSLGLDRLTVGTPTNQTPGPANGPGAAQSVPTLEAGRYIAPGVYLGAKQGTTGTNDTQAELQVNLGRGVKLDTTAGSGYGANSIGLSYQLQY